MTRATVPTLVASENGWTGIIAAMDILRAGGSALDAVEMGARVTEDDPHEHSVGYAGLPNVLGEVELDASIMDGRTLETGAVAAVSGYRHPVTLARKVLEKSPHVLLVADGAERFADALGMQREDLRTPVSTERWQERFDHYGLSSHDPGDLMETARLMTAPLNLDPYRSSLVEVGFDGHDDTKGTVNYLALDSAGNLASSVSTSGIAWKYPGRVGDSPLIGAGNYCDNRYGAAACTGLGELAIRASTARSLVLYLKMGMDLVAAGLEALHDLAWLKDATGDFMNIVALTPDGRWAGFSTVPAKRYLYMTAEMAEPAFALRTTPLDVKADRSGT